MPAFLLPFVFVLDPQGVGLLLKLPKDGSMIDIIEITLKVSLGIIALGCGTQGWALLKTTAIERALLILSGLLLVFPSLIEALVEMILPVDVDYSEWVGIAIGVGVIGKQWMTLRGERSRHASP
jgi:TRAP-type uncharacterized transport system fused permease subunit